MIANLNFVINSSSEESLFANLSQKEVNSIANIIEHDFYKLGYKASGNKIISADSSSIKFLGDVSGNGLPDSVYYYTGSTGELASTQNPFDRILYRKVDNEPALNIGKVTKFQISYYDSISKKFSEASLSSAANLAKIRTLSIYLKVESGEPIDSVYYGAEWKRRIIPKNFN